MPPALLLRFQACPSLIVAQFWRRRRVFISSFVDSVLERSAALESLCFGIGFGRLEWIFFIYNYYINVMFLFLFI